MPAIAASALGPFPLSWNRRRRL